jgi:DNA-binding SARP family transcriptional activator
VELRILGPFQVFDDSGREVALPTGRERALLAALVLRRGEVVSVDALVEALWGDTPPSTAVKAVQGYASHLRRVVGTDGALVTQAPGYALRVPADAVDSHRFATLAAEASRTLEDDPESHSAVPQPTSAAARTRLERRPHSPGLIDVHDLVAGVDLPEWIER